MQRGKQTVLNYTYITDISNYHSGTVFSPDLGSPLQSD